MLGTGVLATVAQNRSSRSRVAFVAGNKNVPDSELSGFENRLPQDLSGIALPRHGGPDPKPDMPADNPQ